MCMQMLIFELPNNDNDFFFTLFLSSISFNHPEFAFVVPQIDHIHIYSSLCLSLSFALVRHVFVQLIIVLLISRIVKCVLTSEINETTKLHTRVCCEAYACSLTLVHWKLKMKTNRERERKSERERL